MPMITAGSKNQRWIMVKKENLPNWAKELLAFTSVHQQFLIDGNIYDFYPYYDEKYGYTTLSLPNYLATILSQEGYENIVMFEPLFGFSLLSGDKEQLQVLGIDFDNKDMIQTNSLAEAIWKVENLLQANDTNSALIVNHCSRIKELYPQEEIDKFLYTFFRYSLNAYPIKVGDISRFNLLIYILDKSKDFPLYYNNSKIRTISIPKPDIETRKKIIQSIIVTFEEYKTLLPERQNELLELLSLYTNSFYGKDILHSFILAKQKRSKINKIFEAIQEYKIGSSEILWSKIGKKQLMKLQEKLNKEIFGQEKAIEKIVKAIQSAYFNLNRLENPENIDRPRLTLLFAGPYEQIHKKLGQSLAKNLFQTESLFFHFDLLEYINKDKALDRLLLTESKLIRIIQENPNSIVMFENFDAAPSDILDFINQIVTKGKVNIDEQEILYFGEAVIILTTNTSLLFDDESFSNDNKKDYHNEVFRILEQKFQKSLLDNLQLIIFDLLKEEDIKWWIQKMIDKTIENIKSFQKITIMMNDISRKRIEEECIKHCNSLDMIKIEKCLQNIFINPLSDLFLRLDIKGGQTILIEKIELQDSRWRLSGYMT